MANINIRDLFPEFTLDCFIEVPDMDVEAFKAGLTKEAANVYVDFQREENAYMRRLYRNNAHYSLDQDDGIENEALSLTHDPFDVVLSAMEEQQLYTALSKLPAVQARRIRAHFLLGMSQRGIAKAEKVSVMAINESIASGLRNLKNLIPNFSD